MEHIPSLARNAIVRGEGVTETERYLKELSDRTFLTPWSFPNIHRRPGDELCDLLAVSGNEIVIFSDKKAAFSEGKLDLAWAKWYREAILESLKQLRGAERWIKNYPDRLFIDRACTERFPLMVPDQTAAKYHRIMIVHGATERCKREIGGAGALKIVPNIIGQMHLASTCDGGEPFAVGLLDQKVGFVHVLDKISIGALLTELDTTSDFLSYLSWKEALVQRGQLERAESELDLLAYYLERVRITNAYQPELPTEIDRITVGAGLWEQYSNSVARDSRHDANSLSYIIDRLIEVFSRNAYGRMEHSASTPGVGGIAQILHFLAREPRTRRRFIGRELDTLLTQTPKNHFLAMTVVHPTRPEEPYYVLLLVSPHQHASDYEEYVQFRLWLLSEYCRAVRYQFGVATDMIGIATDLTSESSRSELALYYDGRKFTEDDKLKAHDFISRTGALQNLAHKTGIESYFSLDEYDSGWFDPGDHGDR